MVSRLLRLPPRHCAHWPARGPASIFESCEVRQTDAEQGGILYGHEELFTIAAPYMGHSLECRGRGGSSCVDGHVVHYGFDLSRRVRHVKSRSYKKRGVALYRGCRETSLRCVLTLKDTIRNSGNLIVGSLVPSNVALHCGILVCRHGPLRCCCLSLCLFCFKGVRTKSWR